MTYINRTIPRTYTASDTADVYASAIFVGGGSATTVTLPDPPNTAAYNGQRLVIKTISAQAHKIDNSGGSGFNAAGGTEDFANFAGLDTEEFIELIAYGGAWYTLGKNGVTLAAT